MDAARGNKIDLFPHNQTAYLAASDMLAETGKAAVIHPTGTGKSFIGFKLAEDHPGSVICWLSPSEYIFRMQMENLKAAGGNEPENIKFFTFARLMNMSVEELAEIRPDYVVIDEFHRAGAEFWGKNVLKMFEMYPEARILGLSATAVRYLDNQRNMADELFEGNVASEMTLGEAITRGILRAPKYIISVYGFQKDLQNLQAQVKRTKNSAVRLKAEDCLDRLRRSLENADGLDRIFKKHMTDRAGKYILFVPNAEVMRRVKTKCRQWFADVDARPHIYTAYSDDPETSREFAAFKNDNSGHLKILLTINMLNEGVHIDGICGVILFRPTISPIIYKQQIGRALSANARREPLIFDIVANVYNLYSVDSLQGEIAETVRILTQKGEGEKIVADGFTVYDEVRESRKLFEELENTLSSSWDEMFARLVQFKKQCGHVNVPANYKTPDKVALGNWCGYQRKIRRGQSNGVLTSDRIQKLDAIGFLWEPAEDAWKRGYDYAARYKDEKGNLDVPSLYKTEDGFALGRWIQVNRSAFASRTLSEERIQLLTDIGMIWDVNEYRWQYNYRLCREYYQKFGKEVPLNYTTPDGSKPGKWLARVKWRHMNKSSWYAPLRDDQVKQLEEIGVVFERKADIQWNDSCRAAENYYRKHGNLDVPSSYVSPEGVRLLCWLDYQRQTYAGLTHSVMTPQRKARLDKMNFDWSLREKKPDTWRRYWDSLSQYRAEHNDQNPSQRYVDANNLCVGRWLANQMRKYRAGTLSREHEQLLRSIGIDFEDVKEKLWVNGYRHAAEYFDRERHLKVPVLYKSDDGYPLGEWLRTQIKAYKAGKLTAERKALLDKLGMDWKTSKTPPSSRENNPAVM